jgi:LytS/YehU family sensor histidine kinase
MQPHFLSNTLLAIQDLCYTDPEKAAVTIVKFSAYLRTSIDVLGKEEQIPFAKEYQHICNFMDIEIIRFGTDLQFETDIGVTDFSVPALSIQPLVENAVHHGIRKKSGSGKVRLTTLREKDGVIIRIADNGVGFEAATAKERSLANIRLRLAAIGATLTIKSRLDIGTEIIITIGGNDALYDR